MAPTSLKTPISEASASWMSWQVPLGVVEAVGLSRQPSCNRTERYASQRNVFQTFFKTVAGRRSRQPA